MIALLAAAALGGEVDDDALRAARRLGARSVAAWVYGGAASSSPPPGKQYVGAELVLKRYAPGIELSDIEAVNVSTKAAYGNPQFACLTDEGAWLDCDEASGRVRVRLVWTVSEAAERLRFTLYGRRLAGRVRIDASGPELPRRQR